MATSVYTLSFKLSVAYLIQTWSKVSAADGRLFWSRVRSLLIKSLQSSDMPFQTGSLKENLPSLTFFMIS